MPRAVRTDQQLTLRVGPTCFRPQCVYFNCPPEPLSCSRWALLLCDRENGKQQGIVNTGEQPEDELFPTVVTTVISWYRRAYDGNRKPQACPQRGCSAVPENLPLRNLRPLQQGFPDHFSQMLQAPDFLVAWYLSDAPVCCLLFVRLLLFATHSTT